MNLDYTDRIRFADRDIFTHYAVTGVGHDAVHLARHAHGLVDDIDDNSPTNNEEENITGVEEPGLSGVSQNDSDVDEEDGAGEGSDSSRSDHDASDDSDSDSDAHF